MAELHPYIQNFMNQLRNVDELQQCVLKGHLIIESALDSIISFIFSHPEHIEDRRFGFVHKVNIARAYFVGRNKSQMWDLVLAINSVRNEIAHTLGGEKRQKKMSEVRRLYLAVIEDEEARKVQTKYPDQIIAIVACAFCVGVLSAMEEHGRALRKRTRPKKKR